MQTAKQLSVPLVNKPGRLAAVLAALAKEKVAFRAFSVMDSGTRGTLRMVPEDLALARSALETISVKFDVADVLLVEVPSQSGAFRKICQRLAVEHLNIDYAYGSLTASGGSKGGALGRDQSERSGQGAARAHGIGSQQWRPLREKAPRTAAFLRPLVRCQPAIDGSLPLAAPVLPQASVALAEPVAQKTSIEG